MHLVSTLVSDDECGGDDGRERERDERECKRVGSLPQPTSMFQLRTKTSALPSSSSLDVEWDIYHELPHLEMNNGLMTRK